MANTIMYVTTPLRGDQVREFQEVQRYLEIGNKADVIRHLVHKEARRIQENAAQPQPAVARD